MNRMRTLATIGIQIVTLWFISSVAHELVAVMNIPFPANVVGLLLTFGALSSGLLPIEKIEKGGSVLLRHMPLLFIPFAAGISAYYPLVRAHGPAITVTIVASAAIGYAVTGWVTQAGLQRAVRRAVVAVAPHG